MAECHFDQEKRITPACLITKADGKTIVASNNHQDGKKWNIRSCKVTQTRLWSASTAEIFLSFPAVDIDQYPPLVPEDLAAESQFCVYMGHIEGPREADIQDINENRLIRVFVGVVDILTAACTPTMGFSLKIQARDRMRWFMDSHLLFNYTQDEDKILGAEGISRTDAIAYIMSAAIGRSQGASMCSADTQSTLCRTDCEGCGVSLKFDVKNGASAVGTHSIFAKEELVTGRTKNKELSASEETQVPTFIYTTRSALTTKQPGTSFFIRESAAIEVLKLLSYQEAYHTEVFQDPHTGHIYYGPRGNDASGLDDKERFNRTYYVRNVPEGMNFSSPNQMFLKFKEETTSINLRTNIVVSGSNSQNLDTSNEAIVHFKHAPHRLKGKTFACRYLMFEDSSIQTKPEAFYIAYALARVMGKDTRVATGVLLGDPSIMPSELMQIVSSPISRLENAGAYAADREKAKEWENRATAFMVQSEEVSKQPNIAEVGKLVDPSGTGFTVVDKGNDRTDVVCKPDVKLKAAEGQNGYYQDQLATIWRVESVVHHFKPNGYVTEVYCLDPY